MAASRHMRCPAPLALLRAALPCCATCTAFDPSFPCHSTKDKVNSPALHLHLHCTCTAASLSPSWSPSCCPRPMQGRCVAITASQRKPSPRPTWAWRSSWHGNCKGMTMYCRLLQCYCVHGMAATQSMRAVSSAHCFVWIRLHHAAPTALHQT